MSNSLILNCQNTENGTFPQLDRNTKEKVETVQILRSSKMVCIPNMAFQYWKSLQSVYIENGGNITKIRQYSFAGCTSLELITIPDNVTTIEYHAFWGCRSLQSIEIPDGVISIGWSAFSNCEKLKSVVIPDSVRTIERRAFYSCPSLQLVEIPESANNIAQDAFGFCGILNQRQTDGSNYHHETTIWLRQRFENLPIHRACYYANKTQQSLNLLSTLIRQNNQSLGATDAMGMTPLHVLCCKSNVTAEMMQIVVEGEPSVLTQIDVTGKTPLQQFLDCRNLALKIGQDAIISLRYLLGKGISVEDLTTLFILDVDNQQIDLSSQDEKTGLLPFMTGATLSECGLGVLYILTMNSDLGAILS